LPRQPVRFRVRIGVSATLNNFEDRLTESKAQPAAYPFSAQVLWRILNRVVDKRRNRFVLVRPVLQGYGGYAEKVPPVWNPRTLSVLCRMKSRRAHQCCGKSFAQCLA